MSDTVTAPPSVVAPGAAAPSQAAVDADSADFAKAVEAISSAATTPPAETPVVTPVPDAVVVAPVAVEPSEDVKVILARMARLEHEAESARDEAAKLRPLSDDAAKFAKIQELKAARNFSAVLTELGVTADELQSMIVDGNKPLDPAVVELKKQTAEMAAFKAELQSREQAAQQARAQVEFKSKELAPKLTATDFPLGRAVYGDGLVDEVFAVLQHMYRSGDKNPSVVAAGKVVEDYISNIRTKLTPSQAVEAQKTTSATTTLTNAPTTTPRVAADMDTDEGRMEAALKFLKGN